ncbi:MAG: amino acid adenylation domain-containing protein [Pyrinomonadaceae bacterium]|nr:amino acid adenylation domain-containing protein [Pyrinomonadaceae bacterium]
MSKLLHQSLTDSAEKYPDRDAFRYGMDSITYAELLEKASRLANALIEARVSRGDRVGILINTSIDSAVALYGILLAGAAYVPIDPASPPARIRFLIEDCDLNVLVSAEDQHSLILDSLSKEVEIECVIGVENELPCRQMAWSEVDAFKSEAPTVSIVEDDLAYIMYTSGTTGLPKGIMHTHFSGMSYARLSRSLYEINEFDRLGNHSPLHFDISTLGFLTMPHSGGTTVIVPEAYKKFPVSLARLIEAEELSIWYSVPLALIQLLQRGMLEEVNLGSLRWVLFGGESFDTEQLRKLIKLIPNARFSNVYGPAEVNQCTFYNFSALPRQVEEVPLGRAWDETEIVLINEGGDLAGGKETGEILVSTSTMMKGYWGSPDMTAKSLHTTEVNKVFYRTGDLARRNEKGELVFQGRRDRQIKTRGYRVEPAGVELVLQRHELIVEAAVFGYEDKDGETSIKAAIVLREGATGLPADLENFVSRSIPKYACPSKYLIVNELPRTGAGKVDYSLIKKQATGRYRFEAAN